jgi:hypothetical protein
MESNDCCDTRRELAEKFSTLARLYSEAVATFTGSRRLTQAQYAKLCGAVEKARERAEEASVQFEQHVKEHHCGFTDYPALSASAGRSD